MVHAVAAARGPDIAGCGAAPDGVLGAVPAFGKDEVHVTVNAGDRRWHGRVDDSLFVTPRARPGRQPLRCAGCGRRNRHDFASCSQDRAPHVLPHHLELARTVPGRLPDCRRAHRRGHHPHRPEGPEFPASRLKAGTSTVTASTANRTTPLRTGDFGQVVLASPLTCGC